MSFLYIDVYQSYLGLLLDTSALQSLQRDSQLNLKVSELDHIRFISIKKTVSCEEAMA
jgi:hypothetical protein